MRERHPRAGTEMAPNLEKMNLNHQSASDGKTSGKHTTTSSMGARRSDVSREVYRR
jgi:hypothetical protein